MAIRAPEGANNWFKIFRGHKILTKLSKLCMDLWWNPYLSVPFPKVQKYEKYLNESTATNDFKSWRKTNSCMNHFLFKLLMFRLHINVCQISWWCLCPSFYVSLNEMITRLITKWGRSGGQDVPVCLAWVSTFFRLKASSSPGLPFPSSPASFLTHTMPPSNAESDVFLKGLK